MSSPYVGEIRLVPFNFAPAGWQYCDGTLLAITQFETLFNLVGTTYGGDGQSTFAVPDLRGRVPVHLGTPLGGPTYNLGAASGEEAVALDVATVPPHGHSLAATTTPGNERSPIHHHFARASGGTMPYSTAAPTATAGAWLSPVAGGSSAHENMAPFLTLAFIISLFGIFPSPT